MKFSGSPFYSVNNLISQGNFAQNMRSRSP